MRASVQVSKRTSLTQENSDMKIGVRKALNVLETAFEIDFDLDILMRFCELQRCKARHCLNCFGIIISSNEEA